jgi:hypothetical protein
LRRLISDCHVWLPSPVEIGRAFRFHCDYRTRLVADVVTGKLDVREAAARLPEEAGEVDLSDLPDESDLSDVSDGAGEPLQEEES